MTDCMALHFYLSDYSYVDAHSQSEPTYPRPLYEANNLIQRGYGRYHIKDTNNMFAFIKYCNEKQPSLSATAVATGVDVAHSVMPSTSINNYDTFYSFCSTNGIRNDVKYFIAGYWNKMSELLGNEFKRLQDSFIIERYVFPALGKIGVSRNEAEGENGQELMTVLTTYLMSTRLSEDLNQTYNSTVQKGDLIPFIYNKSNANTPYDIAKFAYIYLIEGFGGEEEENTEGKSDWKEEYELVFDEEYDLSEEDRKVLRSLASKASEKYYSEKGNKGARLLGATETRIINSGYSIETKIQAIRSITNEILSDLGIEGDYRDMIDKNYLMVKYAMENSHIKDTIKDYEIGVIFNAESKMSQGQTDENNTNTAILSDFQVVELKDTLDKKHITNSDDDTLSDGVEIGELYNQDITGFVIKKNNNSRIGLYNKVLGYEEFNELITHTGTSDDDVRVFAKMYRYRSNPVLNDTDFDGLDDDIDNLPLNNDFGGSRMTVDSDNYSLDLDFNQDFRYMMFKDTVYNDELCTMSLIMSNLAEGTKDITLKQGVHTYDTYRIAGTSTGYMNTLGFRDIKNLSNKTFTLQSGSTVKGNIYIGYKTIDYYRQKRGIIGIFIGGFNDDNANREFLLTPANLEVGNNIYEEIAKQIVDEIDSSKRDLFSAYDLKYCYWLSGKGIAGGIANEVSRQLAEGVDKYCYTFATPYTHKGYGRSYSPNIKNIINEDDFLIKPMIEDSSYYRNGEVYNKSIKQDLLKKYAAHIGVSSSSYKGDVTKANTVAKQLKRLANGLESVRDTLLKSLTNNTGNGNSQVVTQPSTAYTNEATIKLTENNYAFKVANSTKAYYVLSKELDGYDKEGVRNTKYNETEVDMSSGKNITDAELGDRDGYNFNPNLYNDIKDYKRNFDKQKNNNTYKVNDLIFSNYTINDCHSHDVDFTRFWHKTSNEAGKISLLKVEKKEELNKNDQAPHTELYDLEAGDFSKDKTKVAIGFVNDIENTDKQGIGYMGTKNNQDELVNKNAVYKFAKDVIKEICKMEQEVTKSQSNDLLKISDGDRLVTLDGRIVAAFPIALLKGENENNDRTAKVMNRVAPYKKNGIIVEEYVGGIGVSYDAGPDKMYKYVDCVFEDVGTGHQFVVPFIAVDVKNLHHQEGDGSSLRARFTDNRYGQVREHTISHSPKAEKRADGIAYSHRDDERGFEYMNPIEPYIFSPSGNEGLGDDVEQMFHTRFGTAPGSKVRLVSMRIYDKWFANYKYEKVTDELKYDRNALNWWTKIRDNMQKDVENDDDESVFNNDEPNIIVEYHPKVCDCNINHNLGG